MYPLITTNTVVDLDIQSNRQLSCIKEDTIFSEFYWFPNEVKEAIYITGRGIIGANFLFPEKIPGEGPGSSPRRTTIDNTRHTIGT